MPGSRAGGGPGRALNALIWIQLAAVVAVGIATIAKFQLFAAVDEEAHYSFVQEVAEHGRLPVMGTDHISWQAQAIEHGTYPRRSAAAKPLLNWEAFQPPLYYAVAAPVFLIAGNYHTKVIVLRAFDLVLLLAGLAILWRLAKAAFGERWRLPYACALAVVLWPGVEVRAITVSDAALEIPLVALYVLTLWNATIRRDLRLLVASGALLGLAILTQSTLVALAPLLLVPLVAIVRERPRDGRALTAAAMAIAAPLALLAPWVISNERRYGALTAAHFAKRVQGPILSISPHASGLHVLSTHLWWLPRVTYPTEWWAEYDKPLLAILLFGLPVLLVALPLLAALRRPRLLWSLEGALLATPMPIGLLTLVLVGLVVAWPTLLSRYLNPMFPLLAMFTAWAWSARGEARWPGVAAAGLLTALAAFLWLYGAGAFYFTNVGASLGIHA